jgi:predicted DNA-binding transcriptional regulator AlpA
MNLPRLHTLDDIATDPVEALRNHPAASRPKTIALAVEPLLIDRKGLARLLCRSIASLDRDAAAGRLPCPLRIGGSLRWKLSDIREWLDAGAPSGAEWNARKTAASGRK